MTTPSPNPSGSDAGKAPPKGILKRPSARSNPAKTKGLVDKLAAEQGEQNQTPDRRYNTLASATQPAPPPPKGILKRTSSQSNPAKTKAATQLAIEQPPDQTQTQQPRQFSILEQAVQQAEILQRLKESGDIRDPVPLEVFERLSQFPTIRGPGISAANPSPQDAQEFISAVEKFIPSEYDDLIEERNILGNCGYTLCPKPRRDFSQEWKIVTTGIARSKDLNKWCSQKCAVRALYIRVQLDNPTYIRKRDSQAGGGKEITVAKIELREEDSKKTGANGQTTAPSTPDAGFLTHSHKAALAAERIGGSGPTMSEKHSAAAEAAANLSLNLPIRTRQQQVEVTIQEKDTSAAVVQAPDPRKAGSEDMIEGHKISKRFAPKKKRGQDEEDDEEEDDDEDIFPTLRF
ncbi:Rtr1/RPAP2 family-domain-containing protein [Rhypophila decipiens]|uniref:RNA polymerase II subunit B1 CTD phosphatase RPAP2 homolog n=1 Tax=Rhypophila decipiens TaxID=261697 RepID=A0AAN7BAZ7_9PEZI|nr:Rtr1/RPAP2 family-domain-containing protein [Rhypophila decipiens]